MPKLDLVVRYDGERLGKFSTIINPSYMTMKEIESQLYDVIDVIMDSFRDALETNQN